MIQKRSVETHTSGMTLRRLILVAGSQQGVNRNQKCSANLNCKESIHIRKTKWKHYLDHLRPWTSRLLYGHCCVGVSSLVHLGMPCSVVAHLQRPESFVRSKHTTLFPVCWLSWESCVCRDEIQRLRPNPSNSDLWCRGRDWKIDCAVNIHDSSLRTLLYSSITTWTVCMRQILMTYDIYV